METAEKSRQEMTRPRKCRWMHSDYSLCQDEVALGDFLCRYHTFAMERGAFSDLDCSQMDLPERFDAIKNPVDHAADEEDVLYEKAKDREMFKNL
jgi:hypothetical protein